MPPDPPLPPEVGREAARWLRYASEDLGTARTLLAAEAPPRHAAWLAQQAAEKALKAALIAEQQPFPFTHDLIRLCELLPPSWSVLRAEVSWAPLSAYAVEARYPDDLPDVNAREAEAAVADAAATVAAIEADLVPLLR